jgi:hypothetical protein
MLGNGTTMKTILFVTFQPHNFGTNIISVIVTIILRNSLAILTKCVAVGLAATQLKFVTNGVEQEQVMYGSDGIYVNNI